MPGRITWRTGSNELLPCTPGHIVAIQAGSKNLLPKTDGFPPINISDFNSLQNCLSFTRPPGKSSFFETQLVEVSDGQWWWGKIS